MPLPPRELARARSALFGAIDRGLGQNCEFGTNLERHKLLYSNGLQK